VDSEVGIWDVQNAAGCQAIKVISTSGFAASDTAVVIMATQSGGGGGGGAGGGGGTVSVEFDGSAVAFTNPFAVCISNGVDACATLAEDDTDDVVTVGSGPAGMGRAFEYTGAAGIRTPVSADSRAVSLALTRYGVQYALLTNQDGSESPIFAVSAASAAGDVGIPALCLRDDTLNIRSDTEGDYEQCHLDAVGRLYVTGSGTTAAAVPANANYVGVNVSGNLVGVTGSTEGSLTGPVVFLGNPATNALAELGSDPCATGTKVVAFINQTSSEQVITGTASNRTYICFFALTTAADEDVALVSGTGSVCATSTGSLGVGEAAAADGYQFVDSRGIVEGNGSAWIMKSDTDADNICLLQTGSAKVTGRIVYVVAAN
jgi:hypothetical protein